MSAALDGRTWGRWQYKDVNATLLLMDGDTVEYEVGLEQCKDSAEILDWIVQVSEKTGVSRSDVGDLVEAIDELADGLQTKVCGGGGNRRFDFRAYLRGAGAQN